MAASTSFQKKTRVKIPQISGTKPSLLNSQLLISTGVPSLDNVIGGGLAVGTVLLIEEDTYGSYARLLVKYFVAESVMTRQSTLLADLDTDPNSLIQELPAPITDDPAEAMSEGADSGSMKIAWRYQNKPQVQSNQPSAKFGHYYDLTKSMSEETVLSSDVTTLSKHNFTHSLDPCPFMTPHYCKLLQHIHSKIEAGKFSTSQQCDNRRILRIAIHSLGSPLWGESGGVGSDGVSADPSLPRFLYALRSMLRTAYACCLITVPSHLFQDPGFVERLVRLSDTAIRLESFAGSSKEKNPAFKEYHGLLHLRQLPRLNSLISHMPDTLDLAFKLRRKKFTIEMLHLPPELSESASRDQEDPAPRFKPTSLACGGPSSKLDF
ncbi:elongator complex protein 4-like [Haliotis rufescens]|uniref:elongator complex protein 4-like n=1 Tax=Haliotis rufescens TaxID=6454 RepID=UPI00201F50BE|nr:elongator complex protein 4-like [Haliotis rufescens]